MNYAVRALVLLLCLAVVLGAVGCSRDTAAPVISGVCSFDITASAAVVTWTTDEKATAQVEYGATADYGVWSDPDGSLATIHLVRLTGLTQNGAYHYRVRSADASGNEAVSGDFSFSTPQPVTGVALNKASMVVVKGLSEQLVASLLPPDATNRTVAWSSTDNSVASVDADGRVTGVGSGTAMITATTVDQGLTAGCMVTVTPDGQLPAFSVGNGWLYGPPGSDGTLGCQVSEQAEVNGQDCWVFVCSGSGPKGTVTFWVSKTTLLELQWFTWGGPFASSSTVVCSYIPADASLFPLEVGKQYSVTRTETTTWTWSGLESTTTTSVHTCRVEAVEEVAVPAGTFRCFKITDASSEGVDTRWYSDQVRGWVKTVDSVGDIMELKGYSL